MSEIENRLAQCFAAVFPSLPPEAIPTASHETVTEWDSVATVTLLTVIEEEFSITLDFEELEKLTSFSAIAATLAARVN